MMLLVILSQSPPPRQAPTAEARAGCQCQYAASLCTTCMYWLATHRRALQARGNHGDANLIAQAIVRRRRVK